jgi:BRCT domain type II-containing protein
MSLLANRYVAITGKLASMTRIVAHDAIEALGGFPAERVTGSMTPANAVLIIGDKPGAKLARARAQGLPIIDEWGFLRLLPAIEGQAVKLIKSPLETIRNIQGRSLTFTRYYNNYRYG